VNGTLALDFANQAPPAGYPRYVIGNSVGLPDGWSRIYVTVTSTMQVCGAFVAGEAKALHQFEENGVATYSTYLDLPPGGSDPTTSGPCGGRRARQYTLQVQPQPLVNDERWEFGGDLESADPPTAPRPFKLTASLPDEPQDDDSRTLTCT
jgi:hypothetical protein